MIKKCFPVLLTLVMASMAYAQHSDIEFGYDDYTNPQGFIIEQDETTTEGFQFFESEFDEDPGAGADDFFTDEPGFATNQAEMLRVNPNDRIYLRFLDAGDTANGSNIGQGFVNFYNPTTNMIEASHRVSVGGDATGATMDLVLNGGAIESGNNPQLLEIGDTDSDDPGGIHDHLEFDLLDDATAPAGAYGFLIQFEADFADADGNTDGVTNIESDPFWIIINHQLSEDDFENRAVRAFGVVPEPTAAVILMGGFGGILLRRRRKI